MVGVDFSSTAYPQGPLQIPLIATSTVSLAILCLGVGRVGDGQMKEYLWGVEFVNGEPRSLPDLL